MLTRNILSWPGVCGFFKTSWLPRSGVPCCEVVIWCVLYRTWTLFVISARCSSNVRHSLVTPSVSLPHTQSHSATTFAHVLITHASATGSTHAANGGAGHVLLALFRFHLPTLTDTMLRFSHCFSTYSNGALKPPRIVASATHSRGHVETVSQHRPLSTQLFCLRRTTEKGRSLTRTARAHTPVNRNATATPTPITFTSTTANAAATSTPSGVTRPPSWLVHSPRIDTRPFAIGRSTHGNDMNADCTLHNMMQGCPYHLP